MQIENSGPLQPTMCDQNMKSALKTKNYTYHVFSYILSKVIIFLISFSPLLSLSSPPPLFPFSLYFTSHLAPPIVVSLDADQEVIRNETESATLTFRIDDAAPPVLHEALRWFYVANFHIDDPFAGQEITNLLNRTTVSTLTFSDYTNMRYINLTVSNIVQQRVGIGGKTDEGRYFLVATNPAGVAFSYIDLLVYGMYIVT